MFESVLERFLLDGFIGRFFQFDKEQLHLRVWAGDVVLRDLRLKADILNLEPVIGELNLRAHFGSLRRLSIKVPWASLSSSPVQITLDGLYIVCRPSNDDTATTTPPKTSPLSSSSSTPTSSHTQPSSTRDHAHHADRARARGQAWRHKAKALREATLLRERHQEDGRQEDLASGFGFFADANDLEALWSMTGTSSPAATSPASTPKEDGGKATHKAKKGKRGKKEKQTFTERLLAKVVENMQLRITDVHIRYEDDTTVPGHPFSAGFSVQEFSMMTTDVAGNVRFMQPDKDRVDTHKGMVLKSASLYWNCDSPLWTDERELGSTQQLLDRMAQIPRPGQTYDYRFMLFPLYVQIRMVLSRQIFSRNRTEFVKSVKPQYSISATVDNLKLELSQDQLRDCIKLADRISALASRTRVARLFLHAQRYRPLRPAVSIRDDPRAWWVYAIRCIVRLRADLARKRHLRDFGHALQLPRADSPMPNVPVAPWRLSWPIVKRNMEARREYVELYPKSCNVPWLPPATPEELAELRDLEEWLELDQILLFRSLAVQEMRFQAFQHRARLEIERQRQREAKRKRLAESSGIVRAWRSVWSSSSWDDKPAPSPSPAPSPAPSPSPAISTLLDDSTVQLTNEQRRALYAAIDFDGELAHATLPPEFTKTRVQLHVHNIALGLLEENGLRLCHATGSGSLDVRLRPTSSLTRVQLDALEIIDTFTAKTKFPHLLLQRPRAASSPGHVTAPFGQQAEEARDAAENAPSLSALYAAAVDVDDEPLLSIAVERNPLISNNSSPTANSGTPIAYQVKANLAPLQLVYNPEWVTSVTRFFGRVQRTAAHLRAAADDWSVRKRNQLMAQLGRRRGVDLSVDIACPTLILPEDPRSETAPFVITHVSDLRLRSVATAPVPGEAQSVYSFMSISSEPVPTPLRDARVESFDELPPVRFSDVRPRGEALQRSHHFSLEFDNASVSSCASLQHWALAVSSLQSPGPVGDVRVLTALMKPFDLRLSLFTSSNPQLPLVTLHGGLPGLHWRLDPTAYATLSSLRSQISRSMASESGAEPSPGNNDEMLHYYSAMSVSPASSPSTSSPSVLMRARELMSTNAQVVLVGFAIDRFTLDIVDSALNRIVVLDAEELQLRSSIQSLVSTFDFCLGQVRLEDCLQPSGAEFGTLLLAKAEVSVEEEDEDQDEDESKADEAEPIGQQFIRVRSRMRLPSSPDYDGVDLDTEIECGTLDMQWNPDTLATLMHFVFPEEEGESLSAWLKARSERADAKRDKSWRPEGWKTRIVSKVQRLTATFNKEHAARRLVRVEVRDAGFTTLREVYDELGASFEVRSFLKQFVVLDLTSVSSLDTHQWPEAPSEFASLYPALIDLRADTDRGYLDSFYASHGMLHEPPSELLREGDAEYLAALADGGVGGGAPLAPVLVLCVDEIRCVVIDSLMRELTDYFNEGVLAVVSDDIEQTAWRKLTKRSDGSSFVICNFERPLMVIPRHKRSPERLRLDCRFISTRNSFESVAEVLHDDEDVSAPPAAEAEASKTLRLERASLEHAWAPDHMTQKYRVQMRGVRIGSVHQAKEEYLPIADGVDARVDVAFVLDSSATLRQVLADGGRAALRAYPQCLVRTFVPEVQASLSIHQYVLIQRILAENLASTKRKVPLVTTQSTGDIVYRFDTPSEVPFLYRSHAVLAHVDVALLRHSSSAGSQVLCHLVAKPLVVVSEALPLDSVEPLHVALFVDLDVDDASARPPLVRAEQGSSHTLELRWFKKQNAAWARGLSGCFLPTLAAELFNFIDCGNEAAADPAGKRSADELFFDLHMRDTRCRFVHEQDVDAGVLHTVVDVDMQFSHGVQRQMLTRVSNASAWPVVASSSPPTGPPAVSGGAFAWTTVMVGASLDELLELEPMTWTMSARDALLCYDIGNHVQEQWALVRPVARRMFTQQLADGVVPLLVLPGYVSANSSTKNTPRSVVSSLDSWVEEHTLEAEAMQGHVAGDVELNGSVSPHAGRVGRTEASLFRVVMGELTVIVFTRPAREGFRTVPLVKVDARDLNLVLSSVAGVRKQAGDASVAVFGFNRAQVAWEPLIESMLVEWLRELHGEGFKTSLSVEARSPCHANLSSEFVSAALEAHAEWDVRTQPHVEDDEVHFCPYKVVNQTGGTVAYRLTTGGTQLGESSLLGVDDDEADGDWVSVQSDRRPHPLQHPPGVVFGFDASMVALEQSLRLELRLGEAWVPIEDVVVNTLGTYCFALEEREVRRGRWFSKEEVAKHRLPPLAQLLFVDVALRSGARVITLRTGVRVANHMGVPVQLRLGSVEVDGVVEPGASISLPLDPLHTRRVDDLYVRVVGGEWASRGLLLRALAAAKCQRVGEVKRVSGRVLEAGGSVFFHVSIERRACPRVRRHGEVDGAGHKTEAKRVVELSDELQLALHAPVTLHNVLARPLHVRVDGGEVEVAAGSELRLWDVRLQDAVFDFEAKVDGFEWCASGKLRMGGVPVEVERREVPAACGAHDIFVRVPFWLVNRTGLGLEYVGVGETQDRTRVVVECKYQVQELVDGEWDGDLAEFEDVEDDGWVWLGEWECGQMHPLVDGPGASVGRFDADGWEYADGEDGEWSGEVHDEAILRRRRWLRLRMKADAKDGGEEDPVMFAERELSVRVVCPVAYRGLPGLEGRQESRWSAPTEIQDGAMMTVSHSRAHAPGDGHPLHKYRYDMVMNVGLPEDGVSVVELWPRFLLENGLDVPVSVHQGRVLRGQPLVHELASGETQPLYLREARTRELRVTLAQGADPDHDWGWSPAFPIDEVGMMTLRLADGQRPVWLYVRAEVEVVHGRVLLVRLSSAPRDQPEYKLANDSDELVHFRQNTSSGGEAFRTLAPGAQVPFAWGSFFEPREVVLRVGEESMVVPLDQVGFGGELGVRVRIVLKHGSKTLVVGGGSESEESDGVESEDTDLAVLVRASVGSVSLISKGRELSFVSFEGLEWARSMSYLRALRVDSVKVERMQMDNQAEECEWPVCCVSEGLEASLVQREQHVQYMGVAVGDTVVRLEAAFAEALQEYWEEAAAGSGRAGGRSAPQPVDLFELHRVEATVSYRPAFASTLGSIDKANVLLNGMRVEHVDASVLGAAVRLHLWSELLQQLPSLMSSSRLLGNPASLARNLGSGVYDLISEPSQGFLKGPSSFGLGVAKGLGSFVSHSVAGVASTASSLTGSVGDGLASLSGDLSFLEARRGVGVGSRLLNGVVGGVTGVVTTPVREAQRSGVLGFFKGVGLGVVGLVVKPISGAFDAAAGVTGGLASSADGLYEDEREAALRERKRLPRMFYGPGRLFREYSLSDARVNRFVRGLEGEYVDHVVVPVRGERVILVAMSVALRMLRVESVVSARQAWALEWKQVDPMVMDGSVVEVDVAGAVRLDCAGRSIARQVVEWVEEVLCVV